MDDLYKNIEKYNSNKKGKILTVFDEMIAVIKKNNPIVTEFFIRGRKPKISVIFITDSYFTIPKNI